MKALVLYDGYCALCNGVVRFVAPRQRDGALEFVSLQSEQGQAQLKRCGLSTTELDTFVLVEEGACHVRSTAALRLSRHMRFPWPLAYSFALVPEFLRNPIYNWVARNRYKWFGRIPHE